MDSCVFCKIIKGEIPSYKVFENSDFYAFLTINPVKPGHTLVIPKNHTEYIFDMENKELGNLLTISKEIAHKLSNTLKPKTGKVGIMVAGLEVLHAHIHLIPMDEMGDLNFGKEKPASKEELEEILTKINV